MLAKFKCILLGLALIFVVDLTAHAVEPPSSKYNYKIHASDMNATARVELALYCKQIDAPIEPIEPTIELLNCNTNPQAQECNNYSKTYSQIQDCKEAILYVSVVYPNGSSYNINSSGANGNTSTSPQQCTVFNFSAASYPGTFSIQTNQPC